MFYQRIIYRELLDSLKEPEATVITGMRRTGKTSILRQLYEKVAGNKVFLDLENRANREAFLMPDYDLIWKRLLTAYGLDPKRRVFMFLDEIQYLPSAPSIMKYLLDHYDVKFVVTGSSSFYLKNLFSESLAGRKKIFELFPLTFEEFLMFKGKRQALSTDVYDLTTMQSSASDREMYQAYYEEYLKFGGFPGVILKETQAQKEAALKDILYSYIDQDVRRLSDFTKIESFEHIIRLLVPRIGQKIEITKLAAESTLTRPTVLSYLEFLEKTYVIFRVSPFTKSAGREISKAQKLYFCDTGLANVLGPVSAGQQLENAVFNNVRIRYQPEYAFDRIRYYQRTSGAEIDFVLNGKIAVEVKTTASDYDVRPATKLSRNIGLQHTVVVSQNHSPSKNVIYAAQL